MRAPATLCVPGDQGETLTLEEHPTKLARRSTVGAARQRGSSPRVTSNLTHPAGVLSWERDFLLGLAVNVLEDFVSNANQGDEEPMENPMNHTQSNTTVSRARAVAYARVGTAKQRENAPAVSAQIAEIRRYAEAHGLALSGEFVEHGAAGSDDARPELCKMLQEILQPSSKVGIIIVTDRTRFMRDATKARVQEAALREQGIRLVAIRQ